MKSLAERYTSTHNSTHETFADLVFCALVVLVLFVMALAIEVSLRVRTDVTQVAEVTTAEVVKDREPPPLPVDTAEMSTALWKLEAELNAQHQQTVRRDHELRQLQSKLTQKEAEIDAQQKASSRQQNRIANLSAQIANQQRITKAKLASNQGAPIRGGEPAKLKCQGWWEQAGLGRQNMKEFVIEMANGKLHGRGEDIIGAFVLRGCMGRGQILIQKTYFGRHTVNYHGKQHGQGVYKSQWSQKGVGSGPWLIRVRLVEDVVDPARKPHHLAQLTSS